MEFDFLDIVNNIKITEITEDTPRTPFYKDLGDFYLRENKTLCYPEEFSGTSCQSHVKVILNNFRGIPSNFWKFNVDGINSLISESIGPDLLANVIKKPAESKTLQSLTVYYLSTLEVNSISCIEELGTNYLHFIPQNNEICKVVTKEGNPIGWFFIVPSYTIYENSNLLNFTTPQDMSNFWTDIPLDRKTILDRLNSNCKGIDEHFVYLSTHACEWATGIERSEARDQINPLTLPCLGLSSWLQVKYAGFKITPEVEELLKNI